MCFSELTWVFHTLGILAGYEKKKMRSNELHCQPKWLQQKSLGYLSEHCLLEACDRPIFYLNSTEETWSTQTLWLWGNVIIISRIVCVIYIYICIFSFFFTITCSYSFCEELPFWLLGAGNYCVWREGMKESEVHPWNEVKRIAQGQGWDSKSGKLKMSEVKWRYLHTEKLSRLKKRHTHTHKTPKETQPKPHKPQTKKHLQ